MPRLPAPVPPLAGPAVRLSLVASWRRCNCRACWQRGRDDPVLCRFWRSAWVSAKTRLSAATAQRETAAADFCLCRQHRRTALERQPFRRRAWCWRCWAGFRSPPCRLISTGWRPPAGGRDHFCFHAAISAPHWRRWRPRPWFCCSPAEWAGRCCCFCCSRFFGAGCGALQAQGETAQMAMRRAMRRGQLPSCSPAWRR